MKTKFLVLLFVLAAVAFASEKFSSDSFMDMSCFDRDFTPDAQFNYEMTVSTNPNQKIFIPRQNFADLGDLPSTIYMCPGNVDLDTISNSKIIDGYGLVDYLAPYERAGWVCFDLVSYPPAVCNEYPWSAESAPIQFVTQSQMNNEIRPACFIGRIERSNPLFNVIRTEAHVNADYNSGTGNSPIYVNQRALGGVTCLATEQVQLDASGSQTQLRRNDGALSPAPLFGYDPLLTAANWQVPSLSNTNSDTITLNGVSYSGTTYSLEGRIPKPEYCVPVVQILPDAGDNLDAKFTFSNGEFGYSNEDFAGFEINIVEPDSCYLDASISPTKIIPPLTPGEARMFTVSVYNKYDLFDMVATDVQVIEPSYGWSARKAQNPPSSSTYTPKNGFDSPIASRETRQLYVDVIVPDPVQQVPGNEICLNITLESDTEFCDGNKCTNSTKVCLEINPSFYCNISSNSTTPAISLIPGQGLEMSSTCYLDGNPVGCPELTWEASGFYNSDGVTQNISLVSTMDTDGNAPDSFSPYNQPAPPGGYEAPTPYSPIGDKKVITNSPAIPSTALFTYQDYPNVTAATDVGKVIASGVDAQDKPFNCSLDFIKVEDPSKPDYIPVIKVTKVSGSPEDNNEVFELKWGAENIGGAAAIDATTTNMELAPIYFDSKVVSPLGVGEQKTWVRNFECPHPGIFPVRVIVDPLDKIEEEEPNGELNNEAFARINCGGVLVCWDLI